MPEVLLTGSGTAQNTAVIGVSGELIIGGVSGTTTAPLQVDENGLLRTTGGGGASTGSTTLFDKSGVDVYFDSGQVPILGSVAITNTDLKVDIIIDDLVQVTPSGIFYVTASGAGDFTTLGSTAITSSVALTQTGSVAITSTSLLPVSGVDLAGSVAITSSVNLGVTQQTSPWITIGSARQLTSPWITIGSVRQLGPWVGSVNIVTPVTQTGSVAITSSTALVQTGSVAITSSAELTQTGSVAITSAATLTTTGSAHTHILAPQIGSIVNLNLVSGTWVEATPLTGMQGWYVSISGGVAWDFAPGSVGTMVFHSFPTTITSHAEDSNPPSLMFRSTANTSGTLVMYA